MAGRSGGAGSFRGASWRCAAGRPAFDRSTCRTIPQENALIEDTLILGADYYETKEVRVP
jgi:hypothetical protein